MRHLPPIRSAMLPLLTLVVMVLTVGSARAATEPSCVRLVRETPDAYAITIGRGCDLREATFRYPQTDPATGKRLSTQDQLRSIFAENERRASAGEPRPSAVRRGCVPARAVPGDATAEERDLCPNGIVNYFGVASSGPQYPIIWIPKSRVASQAERLEALGRTACGAIGAIEHAADQLPATQQHALRKAAEDCRSRLPEAVERGAEAAKASSDPPPPSVTDLTHERDEARAAVSRLESQLRAKDNEVALVAPRLRLNQWIPALVAAAAFLLAGNVVQAVWHLRNRRAAKAQRQVLVDRDRLARALRALEDEFEARVAAIQQEKEAAIEQMRLSTAQLEVELLETAASQAEAHRAAEEQRWSQMLESTQSELTQELERSLEEARQQSDSTLAELSSAKAEIARLMQELHAAQQEAAQHLRRATSLQHRLQMARSRNAYLEGAAAPEAGSSQPELAVANR